MRVCQFRHPGEPPKGAGAYDAPGVRSILRRGARPSHPGTRICGRGAIAGCALLLAACADREPRWISLARGFEPPALSELARTWNASAPGFALRVDENDAGAWVEHALERSAWQKSPERPGEWRARRPVTAAGVAGSERVTLALDGRPVAQVSRTAGRGLDLEESGLHEAFYLDGDVIALRLDGAREPQHAVFAWRLERGHDAGGVWRARAANVSGDGLCVWPGERAELVCDVPAESALRLVTLGRTLGVGEELVFRVTLDGAPLLEHVQPLADERGVHHVLPLPAGGREDARFVFEVEGQPAVSVFFEPVIGPRDTGTYNARPWPAEPPDIVLFLADTFRADNLAAYGGPPDVAPHLNALSERSVRCLQARSTSVWTLPAHGSLFTGLYPTQHGALEREVTFSPELVTLTERLQAAGYRTGAVTDAAFVSEHYGVDAGFGWFEEQPFEGRNLARTLAWADAFLERDDGRPVFLFVHTYRTHAPYRQGADESNAAYVAFLRRVREALQASDGTQELPALLRPFAAELHELYRGGARALDARFGPWFAALEARGLFERGLFVFKSDPGEAFFEHGEREHRGRPHDEKVKIPLLIHGAGLDPRDLAFGASLIDLAPTLCELAGVPGDPGWAGTSLLELDRERPLFAYNQDERGSFLAIVEGEKKLLSEGAPGERPARRSSEIYDLAQDPLERVNLEAEAPAWVRDLEHKCWPLWEAVDRSVLAPAAIDVPESLAAELEALGYGGGGD